MSRVILFNKPYGVLCQFTGDSPTLADFIDVPRVYAAGRLDKDSEGLVVLTDDGKLQSWISDPRHKLPKTYLVQVDGAIDDDAITRLARGVELKDGKTRPADACLIDDPELGERNPPVRFRKHIPTSWIALTIREGRNRQVRRMTAAVGFPTLRLFRSQIGDWHVDGIASGDYTEGAIGTAGDAGR